MSSKNNTLQSDQSQVSPARKSEIQDWKQNLLDSLNREMIRKYKGKVKDLE